MSKEYEFVSHGKMKYITAFLVRLEQRVTHIHRDLEIGYVMEGVITLRTEERTVILEKGDLYLVNRMEPHEFMTDGTEALVVAIQISPKLMDGFLAPGIHYHYEGCSNVRTDLLSAPELYAQLCAFCIELAYRFLCMEENYEFQCFALCAALIQLLHRALPWRQMDEENYLALKNRANRIMDITNYIDQNFQRKLLLTEIAEKENLSMVYLSHFFKEHMGMSFQEYLSRKRFEYACGLLFHTNRKILDISIGSGFSDVRYLNEMFVSAYGCTPKEYRKGKALKASGLQKMQQDTQSFFTERDALRLLTPLHENAIRIMGQYKLADVF